jgi:hypothetical protein
MLLLLAWVRSHSICWERLFCILVRDEECGLLDGMHGRDDSGRHGASVKWGGWMDWFLGAMQVRRNWYRIRKEIWRTKDLLQLGQKKCWYLCGLDSDVEMKSCIFLLYWHQFMYWFCSLREVEMVMQAVERKRRAIKVLLSALLRVRLLCVWIQTSWSWSRTLFCPLTGTHPSPISDIAYNSNWWIMAILRLNTSLSIL